MLQVFYLEWFFTGMSQFKYVATRFFIIRLFLVFIVFTFIKSSFDYKYYFQMQVALGVLVAILNFYYLKKYNIIDLKSVKNIKSVYVKDHCVLVENNKIKQYRVTVKLSFEIVEKTVLTKKK